MRSDAVRQRAGRRRIPFEFGLAAGSIAMIVVALIDSAAFAPDQSADRLALMAVAVAVFCAVAGWPSGLPVAAVGYLLFDGFLANRYGELTWDHQAGPHAIGVIALAVALGLIVSWLRSRSQRAALVLVTRPSGEVQRETGHARRVRGPRRRLRSPASSPHPQSLRGDSDVAERSASDDQGATSDNRAVNNTAIDIDKEMRDG